MEATVDIDVAIDLMVDAVIITELAQTRPDESTAAVPALQRTGQLPALERDGALPALERDGSIDNQRTGRLPAINRKDKH